MPPSRCGWTSSASAGDAADLRGTRRGQDFAGFIIHLIPTYLVLGAVALAWRFPAIGAIAFAALALTYAVVVHWRPGWVLFIGGPLLLVAALFNVSALFAGAKES